MEIHAIIHGVYFTKVAEIRETISNNCTWDNVSKYLIHLKYSKEKSEEIVDHFFSRLFIW